MFTKKEVIWILISLIILEFIIIFPNEDISIYLMLAPVLAVLVSVMTKKLAADYFNIKIEHKIWEFQRWGFYERSHFKKPFPIGLVLPFFLSIFSLGAIKFLAILQFDATNLPRKRILKRHGIERRSEMNDSDLAFTAAWGFYSLVLLSVIGILIKSPEIARYSIFYGAWNLIPFGKLDGNKLFFGSLFNWILVAVVYILTIIAAVTFV